MDYQKKRTLEALERRFSQAEEEFHVQQNKGKKRSIEDKEIINYDIVEPSSADTVVKKHFSSRKDVELNEPAYVELSNPVHQNLLPTSVEVSDKKFAIDGILHDLFQHGDSARKYMKGSKSTKIEHTILLDNYVNKSTMSNRSNSMALQNFSKRSKKHMSLKRHKKIGSFDLPNEFHKFEIFKPMHEKWKSYMSQLLKIVGKHQLAQCFFDADLHGAIISVVHCKAVSYIGIHGIMVRETEETFVIMTQDNKFRVVPKKLGVFMVQAYNWKITLYGDRLASRNFVQRS